MINTTLSIIHSVHWPLAKQYHVQIDIKRDDRLHPVISGNKWRKLKYLQKDAQDKGAQTLLSMGGNWSNHLHALAYVSKELGMASEAFVRAHPDQPLTPTLEDCQRWGMKLNFTNRIDYANLRQKQDWRAWQETFPTSYWIGEGGFSPLAIKGVTEIAQEVSQDYDYIFVGCGSGATLAGLARAFPNSQVIGIAAFSGAEYLQDSLQQYLGKADNWSLDTAHHCGGFAKSSKELDELRHELETLNHFELDEVYNAKVFLALQSYLQQGLIPKHAKVLVIHTGGLQGNRSDSFARS